MGLFAGERTVLGQLNRRYLLAFLFLSTVLCNFLSVYIHPLSISITFESIPLLIVGFLFGPVAGFINGALADLVSFNWFGDYEYSVWFLLQPASIGFLGGLVHLIKGWNPAKLDLAFKVACGGFTFLYSCIFPEMLPILFIYACIFIFLWERWKTVKNDIRAYILISFVGLVYISSFGIGVLGSIFLNSTGSHLLFFKVRAYKEMIKLLCFFPVIWSFLNWQLKSKSTYGNPF